MAVERRLFVYAGVILAGRVLINDCHQIIEQTPVHLWLLYGVCNYRMSLDQVCCSIQSTDRCFQAGSRVLGSELQFAYNLYV
jgi:hypothetical protein